MNDLKISIIGYGKMGKEIESLALKRKIKVVSIIDPLETSSYEYKIISKESLGNAEICIDFTNPEVVLENIRKMAELKKNIVIGTTGWNEHLKEVKDIVDSNNIGLIYSPNFSIGVNLYMKLIQTASDIIGTKEIYDIFGDEMHHQGKKDSPSGTARELKRIIKEFSGENINFTSTRAGNIIGEHIVGFDSEYDSIEITHRAKNRKGFAEGALLASKFIKDEKGFYTQKDFLNYLIREEN